MEVPAQLRMIIFGTFLLYTAILLGIGVYSQRSMQKVALANYVDEFYTAGRGMGALVVALMIAAGLCSAGTFLGGPGLGYAVGLAWALAGFSQVFMNFCVLGEVGKKIGIVARRIKAQSYLDILVYRYERNPVVALLGVFSLVVFMGAYVTSQFVGGARLFESMTGFPYWLGLVLFSVVVLIYAAFGGMKGVSLAVIVQGLVMTIAVFVLFFAAMGRLMPLEAAIRKIGQLDPKLISPWTWKPEYEFSMWVVFGLVTLGLPHGVLPTLTYKNTKAMRSAIVLGTVFVVLWTLMLIWMGNLTRALIPNLKVPDHAIPSLAMMVLPPWLTGVVLAGVAGAIQSTVGAMILVISAAIVRDAYLAFINPKATAQQLKSVTQTTTVAICAVVFLAALNPPKALEWVIVFAIGGLASSYFFPMLLGLYWWRANEYGAIAGMVGGLVTYMLIKGKILPALAFGMDPIVPSIVVSGLLVVVVSLLTPQPSKRVVLTYFGKGVPEER
ncbi:MAG: sodium/pantothenate symporter [Bacillota bacterium]|nr:sodium/pantothenate symporter [Bacillota bacterium]